MRLHENAATQTRRSPQHQMPITRDASQRFLYQPRYLSPWWRQIQLSCPQSSRIGITLFTKKGLIASAPQSPKPQSATCGDRDLERKQNSTLIPPLASRIRLKRAKKSRRQMHQALKTTHSNASFRLPRPRSPRAVKTSEAPSGWTAAPASKTTGTPRRQTRAIPTTHQPSRHPSRRRFQPNGGPLRQPPGR